MFERFQMSLDYTLKMPRDVYFKVRLLVSGFPEHINLGFEVDYSTHRLFEKMTHIEGRWMKAPLNGFVPYCRDGLRFSSEYM